MKKIESLADNIAYSLAAKKVRVIAPIPGKQAIGVEVPNKKRNKVLLGDLLNTKGFNESKARLPIVLGKDISGKTIIADLQSMPHLLIAGTTGSGKSVCLNSILCSLLYQMRPEELRLILVDPKHVEMNAYSEIPHLLAPVVTEAKKAAMALNWAVDEMEKRYKILKEAGCKDIKGYNEKIDENNENDIALKHRLHYIVIIIDELADLMLIARKEIENAVTRLAAKARAAGIHLIFATQSPRADIITGIIKANFQPRIAFTVATKMESRIVLDGPGAEKLLGQGDMLFYQPGFVDAGAAVRLQGAFVSDKEVEKVTDYLRSTCDTDYVDEIYIEEESESVLEALSESDEPVYHEAVQIVVDEQKASASYLQRRLQIGYNRAARMIEYMESEGIVGPAQGSKPREVLIDVYPY
jgi:S-DNA-T family DNA segregation ATPase FtsK/SpoIIIE